MKIFHHIDLDGRACGAILKRKYPNAESFPYNYWYDADRLLSNIRNDERVIFGDIVPPIPILEEVLKKTKNIVLLDHHSSSKRDVEELGLDYEGTLTEDGLGACILVWEYCYPGSKVPDGIRWIAEYDDWQRTPENKVFQFGLQSFNTFPTNWIWNRVLKEHGPTMKLIERKGKSILQYLVPWYKRLVNSYGMSGMIRPELFDGTQYSTFLLNQGGVDSSVFDDVRIKHDIYVRATFGKSWKWLVSVTSDRDDIDLSKLAKRFGGGGHKHSAGFTVEDLDDFFIFPDE
jgi:oligoribonuclease NrnB/cAMP/cGMP phosphodiesterase (DHH superfamily)